MEIPVKRSVSHPCYDDFTLDYDFMILELEHGDHAFRDHVVRLASPDDHLEDGAALTTMGFGAMLSFHDFGNTGFNFPTVMQEATLNYDTTCGEIPPFDITEAMLCAGGEGMDSCYVSARMKCICWQKNVHEIRI